MTAPTPRRPDVTALLRAALRRLEERQEKEAKD